MICGAMENLVSYVPAVIARLFPADHPPNGAIQGLHSAAVLLADISGFTTMTESLALRGAAGVEELTRCLNVYFGQLIDLIAEHGGDVVKFAGDALVAIWPAETNGK